MMRVAALLAALAVFTADQATKYMLPVVLTTSRGGTFLRLISAGVLIYFAIRFKRTYLGVILAAMAGAGVGNVVDVVQFGHVRDVFVVGTAVFNVADVALVIGLAVVAVMVNFHKPIARAVR